MKSGKYWKRGSMLGAGILISSCVSKSVYLKEVNDAEQLKAQQAALTAQQAALQSQLSAAQRQVTSLQQQLQDTQQSKDTEISKLKGTYDQLVGNLQNEINAGQIKITQLAGRLSVNMVDKILFNSGQSIVKPEGQQVLDHVGAALKNVQDKAIRVEGHTDNVPISPSLLSKFASNWELSTARATSVVRYLEDNVGIPAQRLIAAGYADTHPVASNATPEGRALNRRIEIVLVPIEAVAVSVSSAPPMAVEPPAGSNP